jgi:pheromone shutdown protein TraB
VNLVFFIRTSWLLFCQKALLIGCLLLGEAYERDRLLAITQAKSIARKLITFIKYKLVKNSLLDSRDEFIAKRIDETLNQGETGIIFIGAYHNIKKRLPQDIQIIEIKYADKVREYQMLLPFHNKYKRQFEELSRYLTSRPEA